MILDKYWPNSFAFSVSETSHELFLLRKGAGVESVFKIFFFAFQREELCVVRFWIY